jgi:hypothetical protein
MSPAPAVPAPPTIWAGAASRVAARWRRTLGRPDWPARLRADLRRYVLEHPADGAGWRVRWALYDLVAAALEGGGVALAAEGPDLDGARLPVRHTVLHHSGTLPCVSAARLSAMGLLRLYVPAALRRGGALPWSGHLRRGRPVFHAYHWLIRPDGCAERLLEDHEVGWHAGDWEVNRASVGICLAGDYSRQPPTPAALDAVRRVLGRYPGAALLPHARVNPGTACPGPWAKPEALARLAPARGSTTIDDHSFLPPATPR